MISPLLIYIHGFKSSPLSLKATETEAYLRSHGLALEYRVPQLSDRPEKSVAQLDRIVAGAVAEGRKVGLIGSSLGGFHATWLAERYPVRAVLVNPAVYPSQLMEANRGEHENPYTGERFTIGDAERELFRGLEVARPSHPERLWLMVQQGDETLDYRAAVDYYQASPQTVEAGGDHRFQGFANHLPAILKFLQLLDQPTRG